MQEIDVQQPKIRLDALEGPGTQGAEERFGKRADYEACLVDLQVKMLRIQQAYYQQNRRALIVFEGWDAAGKGGTIRRVTEKLDPRGVQVFPIGAPLPKEQGKHYLYRFWKRLPAAGCMAIFDRSWYGRVLVERVEGLADMPTWQRAYNEINAFERLLLDDGAHIVKLFLHISQEEQLRRFRARLLNPYKRWKLTDDDLRNRGRWPEYQQAIEEMFDNTSTKAAPWHAIASHRKWFARTQALQIITDALSQDVDVSVPPRDPEFLALAMKKLGVDSLDPDEQGNRRNKKK